MQFVEEWLTIMAAERAQNYLDLHKIGSLFEVDMIVSCIVLIYDREKTNDF